MSHVYAASTAVALLLTLLLGGLALAEDTTAGLLLHWRFAEPGGVGVYSKPPMIPMSGFTVGGTQRVLDPQRGPAMQFDGVDGVVSAGSASSYANVGTESFTVMLWVRHTNATVVSAYLMKDIAAGEDNGFYLYTQSSTVSWWNGASDMILGATLPTWQHLAVTRAAGTNALTGYVNGVATASGTDARTFSNNAALTLGLALPDNYPLQGRLASVRVYNRLLGPAEIQQIVQRERLASVPPPTEVFATLLTTVSKSLFFRFFEPQ